MESVVLGPWPLIKLGGLALPTYYIVISAVLMVTTLFVAKRADQKKYSGSLALEIYLNVLIAGVLGARLFHVLYEAPAFYFHNPLEILYFWQGGFVFYGGVLGGLLGGWLTVKKKEQPFELWLDFFAPILSLGYALGRMACFFTGCCYGRACDLPWAPPFTTVELRSGASSIIYRHPTQLYAVILELIVFAVVLYIEKRRMFTRSGNLFFAWLGLHSLGRIVMEMFRDDDRGSLIGPFSVATVLSLIFILIAIARIAPPRFLAGDTKGPLSKD